jgi:hypothetical protein
MFPTPMKPTDGAIARLLDQTVKFVDFVAGGE